MVDDDVVYFLTENNNNIQLNMVNNAYTTQYNVMKLNNSTI